MRDSKSRRGSQQQQQQQGGVPCLIFVLFFLVMASIVLFGYMGLKAAEARTTHGTGCPEESSTRMIRLGDAPPQHQPFMPLKHTFNELAPTDYALLGKRLECMSLINTEVVPKIDTLVRTPRRIATVMLSTMALDVEGDFVEAGVFTGGATILMFSVLNCANSTKHHWMADSFQGLPDPEVNEGDTSALGVKQEEWKQLSKKWTASQRTLYENLDQEGTHRQRYGKWEVDDPRLHTLAGWFKDTLPAAPIEKISFLRCDADMYSSTRECLVFMYPKLSPGGYVYIDDYWSFVACQKAVDDYRQELSITSPLYTIVEDSSFHFVKDMTLDQVKIQRNSFPRGNDKRHVDAVFWRKT